VSKKIKSPMVFFDVDDTLLIFQPTHPEAVDMKIGSYAERVVIHHGHIEALKRHKFRGHGICLWSAGGEDWAEAVGVALGIDEYVDLYLSKPDWFFDDLRSDQFMPEANRIYIETYKGKNVGHGDGNGIRPVGPVYATAATDIGEGEPVLVQNGLAYKI
jgi:hypothetical protein